MRKIRILAILLGVLFAFNGVALGWGAGGGDGSDYRQLQETAVFYNNSSSAIGHGSAVILDISGTAATTLGAYVTTTTTADSKLAVGIARGHSGSSTGWAASSPIVVVTRGPVDTKIDDTGVTAGSAVGTANTRGHVDAGSDLGVALESGASQYRFIWVQHGLD